MRLGKPAIWIGVVSAVLVVALVWTDRERISPGALSPVHAREAELAGTGCERCHGSATRSMAAACLDCHADVAYRGFHAAMPLDASACGTCHVEHHGAELPLVGARAFALAGVEDRDAYDHRGLGFALKGRHASLACRDCHPNADVELLAKGAKRFLGLSQACTSCHEDVHGGKLPDCASCHGQEHPFAQVAEFVHPAAFLLEGAHAGRGCRECHPKGSVDDFEKQAPRKENGQTEAGSVSPRACAACHESPHEEKFVGGASCETCHPAVHEGFTAPLARLEPKQHAATGFALEPPHDRVACEACHPRDAASFAAAHPGREAEDCRACHADPHAGQFERGPFAGSGCLACHHRLAFAPPAFDVELHAKTGFALTGSHAAVPCASCHATAGKFEGAPTECASCHADAHEGRLAKRGCAECHGTVSFADARAGFDHGETGFALRGAHARLDCAACHPAHERVARTEESCTACHADPHGGRLAGADCASCHTQDAFRPLRAPFAHATWTGFELVGAHAKLDCSACHAPSGVPGRVTPARGTDCASCHADPHVGQFASAGRTDCSRCHATSGPFREVDFVHDRDSRFRLDAGHRDLACSACHRPFPVGEGRTAVRYKPLGTACGDCHDSRGKR